jgi:hypothetical protein
MVTICTTYLHTVTLHFAHGAYCRFCMIFGINCYLSKWHATDLCNGEALCFLWGKCLWLGRKVYQNCSSFCCWSLDITWCICCGQWIRGTKFHRVHSFEKEPSPVPLYQGKFSRVAIMQPTVIQRPVLSNMYCRNAPFYQQLTQNVVQWITLPCNEPLHFTCSVAWPCHNNCPLLIC